MESNKALETARKIAEETSMNLFLTGKAGTGKTTFLRDFIESTSKRVVVLAPTGVAAINAGGSTIHSFFQLSFSPYLPGSGFTQGDNRKHKFRKDKQKLIKTLDMIIIDEISMVRPDVLDAVDEVMRRYRNPIKPFGGVQLLLIGDLRQLAPVAKDEEWNILKEVYKSPYFFDSLALKQAGFLMVELEKVYRQSDGEFIEILNSIRDNKIDDNILAKLNQRADMRLKPVDDTGYIRLTSHNASANRINQERLHALHSGNMIYDCAVEGNFPESFYPADSRLELKVGAQVMFIKNDPSGEHQYYNGLLGDVLSVSKTQVVVRPRKDPSLPVTVGYEEWQNTKYTLNENGDIVEEVEGVFRQIPLRLAWAITIHKSQGLTFDKAIIDATHSFAPGQTYVALSRCRTLEGLLLENPIPRHAIITDLTVNAFIENQPRLKDDANGDLEKFKSSYYNEMLFELFDISQLEREYDIFYRRVGESLGGAFPRFMEEAGHGIVILHDMKCVVQKLYSFLSGALPARERPDVQALIDSKISGGTRYFLQYINQLIKIEKFTPLDSVDNSTMKRRLKAGIESLDDVLTLKYGLFTEFGNKNFNPQEYLKCKTWILLNSKIANVSAVRAETNVKNTADDIENSELYNRLKDWRYQRSNGKFCFKVMHNKTLMEIANSMPRSAAELAMLPGMGKVKMDNYADEILEIVNTYCKDSDL